MKKLVVAIVSGLTVAATEAYADWTPLIGSNDFSGIKTDLQTAVVGILGLMLVILGVTMVVRMITGR